jgi:hypothetical protein
MNIDESDLCTVACSVFGVFTGDLLWVLLGGARIGLSMLWGFGGWSSGHWS